MERPKKIVLVDASVVTKWFVEEEHTQEALRMRDDYRRGAIDLRSTQLMPFEVLNALRYNSELGQREIERAGEALSRFKMALYPLLDDLKTLCVRIALAHGMTIYDASYVSLSQFLDRELYTADEKLLAKAQGESQAVRHLREYQ